MNRPIEALSPKCGVDDVTVLSDLDYIYGENGGELLQR